MTNTESVNLLLRLAKNGRPSYHPGYEFTVQYAKECKAYFAGVGLDDFLRPFARRESAELFNQRKLITAHVQKSLGYALERPFSKIQRSNWTKVLSFEKDEGGKRAGAFEKDVLGKFTKHGLDDYVFQRLRYWNAYDPNCFIVAEFAPFDNTKQKAQPYPFEVTADMAVAFRYDTLGELMYLVARQTEMKPDKTGDTATKEFERLTIYQPKQTLVIQQMTRAEVEALPVIPSKSETIEGEPIDGQVVNIDDTRFYRIIIPIPHNFERTPAIRAGYVENPEDDGQTVLGIFDAALPWAKKLLKTNSEADLTAALLAFPISVRYQEVCANTGCDHGHMPDGSVCMECHGTGYKPRPTSAQEELVLPMPDRPEDMFDPSKLMTYVYPPVDAVRLQIDLLKFYFQQAKESVFNAQMATKDEVAQTAMFHRIGQESTYDTLHPYGRNLATIWRFLAEVCKAFTGTDGAMTAAIIIPQDFRFELVDQLFAELKSAREAGAGNDVAVLIGERIMERYLIDDKERLARWRIDARFDPFPGMTEAQIVLALASPLTPERKKIFYLNRVSIMEEILEEKPTFYTLSFQAQKALIEEKITAVQAALQAAQPTLNVGALGDNSPQPEGNAE